jgi:hypothetical protein
MMKDSPSKVGLNASFGGVDKLIQIADAVQSGQRRLSRLVAFTFA